MRGDRWIARRAAEEFYAWIVEKRIGVRTGCKRLSIDRKLPSEWYNLVCNPSADSLKQMAQNGLDVGYILTGRRGTDVIK